MQPKVFYDWGSRVQIGPLGWWNVGETATLDDGRVVHVGSVDLDGMAIAWSEERLQAMVATSDAFNSTDEALACADRTADQQRPGRAVQADRRARSPGARAVRAGSGIGHDRAGGASWLSR